MDKQELQNQMNELAMEIGTKFIDGVLGMKKIYGLSDNQCEIVVRNHHGVDYVLYFEILGPHEKQKK